MQGLIHIYTGNGKGKTTAACGLVLRYVGTGQQAVFAQFLKNNQSGELKTLKCMEQVSLFLPEETYSFIRNMSEEELQRAKATYQKLFFEAVTYCKTHEVGLLVLDEILGALNRKILPLEEVIAFLEEKPENLEVVLTGRNAAEELVARADYVTEMKKEKHPYDKGIRARKGIEF